VTIYKYSDKWTKIAMMHIRMWFGNNQDNFQLHWFTTSENIAKCRRGYFFD